MWLAVRSGARQEGAEMTTTADMDMPVITVRLPDPSALSWEERAAMRSRLATGVRWLRKSDRYADPVGVDLVPLGDAR